MLSKIPIDVGELRQENINKEILRLSIIAELDAVNLYEQLFDMTDDISLRKILSSVVEEEKTHIGEFETLLLKMDSEQEKELSKGKKEAEELLGNEESEKACD